MAAAEIAGLEPQQKPSAHKPNHRPGTAKRNKPKFGGQARKSSGPRFGARTGSFQTPAISIGIKEADRKKIAEGLSHLLADTYTLYLTTHNFHWNVTGPMFTSLHTMFMTQYTELWNAVDPIAERIRSLGYPAPGSYGQFGKLSSLADAPARPPKALEMVAILVTGHEAVARTARGIFPIADKAGDEPTADLLTQRLTVHEQSAWMLRSLLE